ncbi:MAG: hypothetical protein J3Q66DRAFT_407707 [Benniella sp.]|nr:MAG: hypothetical protein J3Q66DRAFT_407707 [Benniella sp.]
MKICQEPCKIFFEPGSEEISTNKFVESPSGSFDALFQPQRHPVHDGVVVLSGDDWIPTTPRSSCRGFACVCKVPGAGAQVTKDVAAGTCRKHGAWGLDHYQFLSYLWGSMQLRDYPRLKPIAAMDAQQVEDYEPDYVPDVGLSGVIQDSLSASMAQGELGHDQYVQGWSVCKLPVVQLFGSLLPWRQADSPDEFAAASLATVAPSPTAIPIAPVPGIRTYHLQVDEAATMTFGCQWTKVCEWRRATQGVSMA